MKKYATDLGLGLGVFALSMLCQYAGYLLGLALGLPFIYDTAPDNPGAAPGWLDQINLMHLLAAVPMFLVSGALAQLARIRSAGEGLRRGLIWAAVVAVLNLVVTIGNGTQAMFAAIGFYVFLASVLFGPVTVGWFRQRRPAR